jgi:hypothetical protein
MISFIFIFWKCRDVVFRLSRFLLILRLRIIMFLDWLLWIFLLRILRMNFFNLWFFWIIFLFLGTLWILINGMLYCRKIVIFVFMNWLNDDGFVIHIIFLFIIVNVAFGRVFNFAKLFYLFLVDWFLDLRLINS